MTGALANLEDNIPERPNGLVVVRIDKKSGKLSSVGNPSSVFEVFESLMFPRGRGLQIIALPKKVDKKGR